MQPSEEMVDAASMVLFDHGYLGDSGITEEMLAAAINAMSNDLRRVLVKERGCVLVPRKKMELLYQALLINESNVAFKMVGAMLAAAEAEK